MASKYDTELDLGNRNSSHALIAEFVGPDKRVLDVGCATGFLAEALARRGCTVTGIEADPEAAGEAGKHCESVVVGDVETEAVRRDLGQESFDVIIFGDVLEHLKDPLQTLRGLEPFLRPGGYVVASIPNIAHGSVRLALLQGRFRYRELGLLDDTHLRFFTRESVQRMFDDAGFVIAGLERTMRGMFETEVEVDQSAVPEEVLRLVCEDPEAMTYQFVLSARRIGEEDPAAESVRLLSEQLAERDREIYTLNRKLRNNEDLKRMLDARTEELAEKEREVTALTEEAAERTDRMARLVQFGRDKA